VIFSYIHDVNKLSQQYMQVKSRNESGYGRKFSLPRDKQDVMKSWKMLPYDGPM